MGKKKRRKRKAPNPHRPPFRAVRRPDGKVDPINPPADFDFADELVRNCNGWFTKARELLYAASLLERAIAARFPNPPSVHGSYFMLVAYAIENLCKGQLLRDRSEELRATVAKQIKEREPVKLPEWLKTHKLLALARSVGLAPSFAEEDLLKRLTFNSEWFGRYPLPTDSERFDESFPPKEAVLVELSHPTQPTIDVCAEGVLSCYYNNDLERVHLLLEKIKDLTERKQQPQTGR